MAWVASPRCLVRFARVGRGGGEVKRRRGTFNPFSLTLPTVRVASVNATVRETLDPSPVREKVKEG